MKVLMVVQGLAVAAVAQAVTVSRQSNGSRSRKSRNRRHKVVEAVVPSICAAVVRYW